MLPIAKAKGKTREKFLGMERDLARDLLRLWLDTCAKALKGIFQDIPDFTSKEAMELLQQSLADLLGPAFGSSPEAQGVMKWGVQRAYRAAKSQFIMPVPEKGKASPPLSLPDHRAISVLTRHNCFWLGERYGKAIRPKIAKLAQEALDEGLGRDQLAELLRRGLGEAAPGGYTYWDVVASSAIVRARSFGTVSGMEEAGITEYEILAMGDERMCPICGALNGTVFSVAETRKVVNKALDITDPKKFKETMPWHKGSPLGQSISRLTANGQSLPPFHGRCRCTMVVASESSIEQYGNTIEERALHINEFNKAQKIQLLSELADIRGVSYTKDKLRSGEDIYKDDGGYFIYPLNNGFAGEIRETVLRPRHNGEAVLIDLIDRYGDIGGRYFSPAGTPIEKRALPSISRKESLYHKYRVLAPLRVKMGIVAGWFEQPGGGIQYMTEKIVRELLADGDLEEVSE